MARTRCATALVAVTMTLWGCGGKVAGCPSGQTLDGAGACRAACSNDAECDDGDLCNGLEVCQAGTCFAGTPTFTAPCQPCRAAACDDGNPCTDDSCSGSYCSHTPNAAACEDGVACTTGDTCQNGVCTAGTPDDGACTDGVGCTTDRCDALAGCTSTLDDAACDDGIDCTDDSCHPTEDCLHTPVHALCHDGVVCTVDTCDPELGCVSTPADAACDDGVDCTTDSCDPIVGCVFPPNHAACDDGVGCTRDLCDGRQGCHSEPDDTACVAGACEVGACDAQADCHFTPRSNLTACGTGGLCVSGACALMAEGSATRTDAPQCIPTTWTVDDLAYSANEGGFLALVDITVGQWSGSACSAPSARAGVFLFSAGNISPYGADLAGTGHALADPFVLVEAGATHVVGIMNTSTNSVDWTNGNWMESKLDAVAGVGVLRRASLFDTGNVFMLAHTRNLMLAGASSTTPANGIVVSCSWSVGGFCPPPGPCLPNPACSLTTTVTSSELTGIEAWTVANGVFRSYSGAVATANPASGGRQVLSDDTNRDKNLATVATSDVAGTWAGVAPTGVPGEFLFYGTEALVCRDLVNNGHLDCMRVPGARADRYYYDATSLPGGGVALLARSVCAACSGTSYFLVVVRNDVVVSDALWEEYLLSYQSLSPPIPAPLPQRLAAGGGGVLVLGVNAPRTGAYAWQLTP